MLQDKMPQIRRGQNATIRKPNKMPRNKDASKIVTIRVTTVNERITRGVTNVQQMCNSGVTNM